MMESGRVGLCLAALQYGQGSEKTSKNTHPLSDAHTPLSSTRETNTGSGALPFLEFNFSFPSPTSFSYFFLRFPVHSRTTLQRAVPLGTTSDRNKF